MSREQTTERLAARIAGLQVLHPVRVGIDGTDAAGKTTFADALAAALAAFERPIIRASLDGFHRPRGQRHQRGDVSAQGYYEDSFDYLALQEALLLPLGPGGNRRYRRAVFDVRTDAPLATSTETAPDDAILLFDGVFLFRPEIADLWDYAIFLKIVFEVGLQRALQRDANLFGSRAATERRHLQRYYPGQRLYLAQARPEQRAHAIVDNNNPHAPTLLVFKEEIP
jgi:uridine kinase